MVKNTMLIKDKRTGKKYECFTQSVDLNCDGIYVLRYNIGINGYTEWTNICCIYDNNTFNVNYEVLSENYNA